MSLFDDVLTASMVNSELSRLSDDEKKVIGQTNSWLAYQHISRWISKHRDECDDSAEGIAVRKKLDTIIASIERSMDKDFPFAKKY